MQQHLCDPNANKKKVMYFGTLKTKIALTLFFFYETDFEIIVI